MPKLIDSLPAGKRVGLLRVIGDLKALAVEADDFNKKIIHYQSMLKQSSSYDEFHDVVKQIVITERAANSCLQSVMIGLDAEMMRALVELAEADETLSMILNAANFSDVLNESIIETKERVSELVVLSLIANDKKGLATSFIDSIKSLKPVADEINAQRVQFVDVLGELDSSDDLDVVEAQIAERDKIISGIYNRLVIFPEDEAVASALVVSSPYHRVNAIIAI